MPWKLRYFLDPFGCAKNQVDAENIIAHLNEAGWVSSASEDADLIIVNSCGFIESAKQESINAVLAWRNHYPEKKILLAGCLSQRYAKDLAGIMPEADGFIGIVHPAEVVRAALELCQPTGYEKTLKEIVAGKFSSLQTGKRPLLSLPGSAYIKISEGCNNHCTYCAIPLIRGSLSSRSIPDIVNECKLLLEIPQAGSRMIKELCIIAQDTGSFGLDLKPPGFQTASKLPDLLDAISMLEGNFWVRLLYIHPDHFPHKILDIMERDKRILPYFDLPFQHASLKILSAMNRHGTAEKYLELIKTIRSRLPDAVIRSTFLLGFPGETEEDFSALLEFQEKASLDWLGCFAYSREEGTPAYSMKGQVSSKTAAARKRIIEERQIPITEKNIDRFTGKTLDVLIEEQINNEEGESIWLGRLYCHAPEIDGAAVLVNAGKTILPLGDFAPCRVITRRGFDLEVSLIT